MTAPIDLTASLTKIRDLHPKIDEILQCSPFDKTRNLGGRLTPELFFQRLFIETAEIKALEVELVDALTSELENNRIIFLEGYSGTGKTTFIRHFLNTHSEFESEYIDFYPHGHSLEPFQTVIPATVDLKNTQDDLERLKRNLNVRDKEVIQRAIGQLDSVRKFEREVREFNEQTHPIATALKFHLSKDHPGIADFLYYLESNKLILRDYFETFFEALEEFEPAKALNNLWQLWPKASFRDTFILFFLYHVNNYRKLSSSIDKVHLFVFDNLDTIALAYLTPFFKESFATALGLFSDMMQNPQLFNEELDFEHHFKFIFCLRDANNSTINAHLGDTLVPMATNINLRVGFGGELYKSALTRRLEFHSEVTGEPEIVRRESAKQAVSMLSAFAADPFFTRILVPLYNSDFRKLTDSLFHVTKNLIKAPRRPCGLSFEDVGTSFTGTPGARYGMRGALLFGVVERLREDNFLINYPFTKEMRVEASGDCLTTRMLLTLLLNHSGLTRGEDVFSKRKPFTSVPLGLLIEEAKDIYGVNEIVSTLVEIFLFHQRSWVHLITFRDRPVHGMDAFKDEIERLSHESDLPVSLYEVYLTLNPAGYIFLKNLMVHFEFYSALGGNKSALFTQGLNLIEGEPEVYEFEETIKRVLRLVKKHSAAMKVFFHNKFETGRRMTSDDYLRSPFVFKHFKNSAPAEAGLFHATRIVSHHIAYVDRFRLWLLKRCKNANREITLTVNKKLVGFLEQYLEILEEWPLDLIEVRNYMLKNVAAIKQTRYEDFNSRINWPLERTQHRKRFR